MPNIGRPSRDCYACRQRRVKCDLTRPECKKCVKKGLRCYGYRDKLDLCFRIETVSSLQSRMDGDGHRSRYRGDNLYPSAESQSLEAITSGRPVYVEETKVCSPPMVYPLTESWSNHFMPLTMNYLKDAFGVASDLFHTITRMISKVEEGSVLYQACNAVGFAYIATQRQYPKTIPTRARIYGTALKAVNRAIQDQQQLRSDRTLLSVWLLGRCELLLGSLHSVTSSIESSAWDVHTRGLIELIRLQSQDLFDTQDRRNLFWVAFTAVQVYAISTGKRCPPEAGSWIREIYGRSGVAEYPVLQVGVFSYNCTLLCSRIRQLVDECDLDELLSSSSSILLELDQMEMKAHPSSHERLISGCAVSPALTSSSGPDNTEPRHVGAYAFQVNFRIRLLYHIIEFLLLASRAPSCTSQQQADFSNIQDRCIGELRTLTSNTSHVLGPTSRASSVTKLNQYIRTHLLPRFGPIAESQTKIIENTMLE
ncbi:hypothetical protein BGW36DRAFT_301336 [Talaromyces proteolyticus]|uniref:Zn(2)-C6 fungal-type domain-containing protein n=1 Tax=Talaromyces proteolyticus TaxID=1131652 RepID=A0AAD4KP36_9EURO|nr:uncharacterized protein BGW36DRAFT_301336 [Talaromyces proteolyticus]KAH8693588.1 hypothetical protein BGW36DRAFT_301336 [Talaromyces proteolyticus]